MANFVPSQIGDIQNLQSTLDSKLTSSSANSLYAPKTVPYQLFHWRKALARVRAGAGTAKIACVGDSTTYGVGSSTNATCPSYHGYPADLSSLLNSYHAPSAPGFAAPLTDYAGNPDSRWTYGTGWTRNSLGGFSSVQASSATQPLVFADPRILADSFDIYVLTSAGGGLAPFTATATGGSPVTFNPGIGSGAVGKFTVTAGSLSTSNSVSITCTGNSYLVGIEPYNSTASNVRVGSLCAGGIELANIVSDGTFGGIPLIKAYAPDLTIISIGLNDASVPMATGTYHDDVVSVVTAAQLSGDVILCTPMPSGQTPQSTVVPTYNAQLYTIGAAMGIPVIDLYARNNSAFISDFMNDNLHCNDIGYYDWAEAVFNTLGAY